MHKWYNYVTKGKLLNTPEVPQMRTLSSHMNCESHHKFN